MKITQEVRDFAAKQNQSGGFLPRRHAPRSGGGRGGHGGDEREVPGEGRGDLSAGGGLIRASLARALMLSLGLASCGRTQVSAPDFCRYGGMTGAMCDTAPDPSSYPYRLALGLRGLERLSAADRDIVEAYAARMRPAAGAIRILTPVAAPPRDRAPPGAGPPFPQQYGDARLLVVGTGLPGRPGLVDLHALVLGRGTVLSDQLLVRGLRAESVTGAADRGLYAGGFSLTDRAGDVGDLFVRHANYSRLDYDHPEPAGPPLFRRIPAGSQERRQRFFELIYEPGSCGPDPDTVLLLAHPPQAWLDEYRRSCAAGPKDLNPYIRLPAAPR